MPESAFKIDHMQSVYGCARLNTNTMILKLSLIARVKLTVKLY